MGGSGCRNLVERHLSDASGRRVDDAAQRLVIARVNYQSHISQQIFYLLALVEGHAAIYLIGNVAVAKCLLQSAGLGIRPIQNRNVTVLSSASPNSRVNIRCNQR